MNNILWKFVEKFVFYKFFFIAFIRGVDGLILSNPEAIIFIESWLFFYEYIW